MEANKRKNKSSIILIIALLITTSCFGVVSYVIYNDYNRLEAKESMLDNNPELKRMYSANDNNTEVLYFEEAIATIYSFTNEPKIIKL